jgi:hypothetical protein
MSTDANDRKREAPGTTVGGRFAREAHAEPSTILGAYASATTVRVTGAPGARTTLFAHALAAVPGLGDVALQVDRDDPFAATATVHGLEYRISDYERGWYRVAARGRYMNDSVGEIDDLEATLGKKLKSVKREAIADDTLKAVELSIRKEYVAMPVAKHPVALRRDAAAGVTEVGFSLPGDHMKVRVFDQPLTGAGLKAPAAGELFASSPITDGTGGLTARQNTNRLNKVLDAIRPDGRRADAEQYLRRYLALARDEFDLRVSTDPLLAAKESA